MDAHTDGLAFEGSLPPDADAALRKMIAPEIMLYRVVEQIFDQRVAYMCVRGSVCCVGVVVVTHNVYSQSSCLLLVTRP